MLLSYFSRVLTVNNLLIISEWESQKNLALAGAGILI